MPPNPALDCFNGFLIILFLPLNVCSGAGQEVGRSCIILEFKGRKIMVSIISGIIAVWYWKLDLGLVHGNMYSTTESHPSLGSDCWHSQENTVTLSVLAITVWPSEPVIPAAPAERDVRVYSQHCAERLTHLCLVIESIK